MPERIAFVLGGGGSRGALQVGALRALLEAGIRPDLLVGTSVGAINATFLAMHGFTEQGLDELEEAWQEAAAADLLPSNYLWLTVRTLFNRSREYPAHRMRDFFVEHGVEESLHFGDLPQKVRLIQVATDLNHHCYALYGVDPNQSVLEGLLASTALPPWMQPLQFEGRMLVDGGVISPLPIEPALTQGATRIIAMDIGDHRTPVAERNGFAVFINKLVGTTAQRAMELEMALAAARHVPVHLLKLRASRMVPIWDFLYTEELIEIGYDIARDEITAWPDFRAPRWTRWIPWQGRRPVDRL